MNKPLVYIVGTGGTIASRYDPELRGHVSAVSAADLTAAIPELPALAEVRVIEHSNINSALMDAQTAFALRDTLRDVLKDERVAGIVVTHGTATLEETAYLMDLTVGTEKPIVITGAQRNADEKDPDGPRNVLNAVRIATDRNAEGKGVMVALGGEIHSAVDAIKVNPERLTCFGARDGGPIGSVSSYGVTFFAVPQRRLHLEVSGIHPDVHIIKMVQGSSNLLFRACVEAKVDGIIVEGTGGGNMNLPFYEGVCMALGAGIPVIAAQRLPSGSPHPGKGYLGSFQSIARQGAISAGYLSGVKARVLLSVALGYTSDREHLRAIFARAGGLATA